MAEGEDEARANTHADLSSGTVVGHYRILGLLGAGGMGEVYLAADINLDRKVALKFLSANLCQDTGCRTRFAREAQTAARLSHPNIVTIHEVGEHRGRPFFAMELLEGVSLKELIRQRELSLGEVLDIAIQVCDGLAEAHNAKLVHRDIKPANLILDKKGRAKIADFGLVSVPGDLKVTKSGSTLGTIGYMSPEQVRGERLDHRTDLFSLGAVLYEMIAGRAPFAREYDAATINAILNEDPEPLARYKAGVPDSLQQIVSKALSKNAAARYQHADDLLADLRRVRESLSASGRPFALAGPRSRRWGYVAAVVLGLALIAAAVYWLRTPKSAVPAEPVQRQLTFVGDATMCAISPDADFVAYGRQSDTSAHVLLQDLAGGEPIELLSSEVVEGIEWSPDGRTLAVVAWTSDETARSGLFLIPRLGGKERWLISGGALASVSWSPDGRRLAFAVGAVPRIWIIDSETADTLSFPVTGEFDWIFNLAWSPREDLLLFQSRGKVNALWSVRTDGSQLKMVADGWRYCPRWSPSGDAIYWLRGSGEQYELRRAPADPRTGEIRGEPQTVLANLDLLLRHGTIALWWPSRDYRCIAYPRGSKYSNIWLAPLPSGSAGVRPQPSEVTTGTARSRDPRFSPDGLSLAFITQLGNNADLFTYSLRGKYTEQRTYDGKAWYSPVWSSDGRQIAFASWRDAEWQLGILDLEELQIRYLDSLSLSPRMEWHPGPRILYQGPSNMSVRGVDPVTGVESRVTTEAEDSLGWVFSPRYSPSGDRIVVHWNRGTRKLVGAGRSDDGLWLISLTDGSRRILSREFPAPIQWSADGEWIFAWDGSQRNRPVVARIRASGGPWDTVAALPLNRVEDIDRSPDGRNLAVTVATQTSDVWLVEWPAPNSD